MLNSEMRI